MSQIISDLQSLKTCYLTLDKKSLLTSLIKKKKERKLRPNEAV